MLNYLNFPHPFKIWIFTFGLFCASCHNVNVKSDRHVVSVDSASRPGDTVLTKINSYTARITSNPKDANAYWNRGKLEFLNKSLGLALVDLTKAVMLDSTNSEYYCSLADAEFRTDRTREARDAFLISIRLNPKNTEAILKLAELYMYVKKYDDALGLIDQAIKINPYIAQEYFQKGMIFIYKQDTARAISSMQTAIEQDPDYFDAYIQLGLWVGNTGNPVALTYFDDASRLQPQNPEPYYDKGMFYQSVGDDTSAIKEYNKLLLLDSTYKQAWYNLGDIYNEHKHDYAKSLEYFTKAIKCDTVSYMAYYARGDSYENLKQFDNALADYARAYRINPQFKVAESAYKKLKSKYHK